MAVLPGQQLVVRMQYDDSITVTQCYLDQVLSSIDQSLENSKSKGVLDRFDVTLGARVNSATTTEQGIQREVGGCGLLSLVSSPTENYSFYARTSVRGSSSSCTKVSTILVEVFANVEISLKDTRGEVIKAVTQAIESFIVNQPENKGADVKICVLNFLTANC